MKNKKVIEDEEKKENTHVEPVENSVENSEIDILKNQVEELTNDLQRTRADFENFRKQTEAQKNQAKQIEKLATILRFLPLLDDIDRAVQTYPEQLSPLQKSIDKLKSELLLEKIDSHEGTDFNPDLHEAVMVEEGDGEKEIIAETLRPGYLYDGQVVRPAMVKVKRV
ncbi:nucleotide exchange factor GrpE [Candidatus Saccharibacteria bacterium]|nr:nucleotide exchange factor GrpE [Candidatus Saccharibacteria bacterium]